MYPRRSFLQRSALVSLAPTIPAFLRTVCEAEDARSEKILVVVQLSGGNDGLNTLVQYKDEGYLANRTALRLPEDSIIKLDDRLALHPAMRGMADLLDEGKLAIVQGVGYPNPNRSHDVSMAVWHTARTDVELHRDSGWLGRAMDQIVLSPRTTASVTTAETAVPDALRGRKSTVASIGSLDEFGIPSGASFSPISFSPTATSELADFMRRATLDAYATAEQMQHLRESALRHKSSGLSKLRSSLAGQLQVITDLIQADFGARVYYANQPGYDTHSEQLNDHARLLGDLSSSLSAFLQDLAASGNARRVLVMCFSEFGRQVKENASGGTDHGTAGPVFLVAPAIKSGLHGEPLDLQHLTDNAPSHGIDFRSVYASMLRDWLELDPASVLDGYATCLPRSVKGTGVLK